MIPRLCVLGRTVLSVLGVEGTDEGLQHTLGLCSFPEVLATPCFLTDCVFLASRYCWAVR